MMLSLRIQVRCFAPPPPPGRRPAIFLRPSSGSLVLVLTVHCCEQLATPHMAVARQPPPTAATHLQEFARVWRRFAQQ